MACARGWGLYPYYYLLTTTILSDAFLGSLSSLWSGKGVGVNKLAGSCGGDVEMRMSPRLRCIFRFLLHMLAIWSFFGVVCFVFVFGRGNDDR